MADESLDEILSSASPAPAAEATTEAPEQPASNPTEGAARDEHGRFAPKAAAEPTTTEPPTVAEPERSDMVPQQALHEARQREKAERERADRFEQALLARSQPPAPAAPTPEPPKVPDFWEAPDQFVNHALTPLQQSMHAQKLDFSRMMAESKFGEDVVKAADTALGDLAKTDRATAEQVAAKMHASRHPYAELVTWHQQEKAKQRVGSDPDAFVQSEIDRIAADPAKRAELLARLTGVPAAVPGADNRPSNITRLPPSLARLPGGNAEPVAGDESLESILHAGRGR